MPVRMLGPGDEDVLWEVLRRFKPGAELADQEAFLGDERSVAWVAQWRGSVVGWCWGHVLARPDGRRDLLLYELEVAASHRRRGHGRHLLDAALRVASELDLGEVWLLADADNEGAHALYRSAGGSAIGQVMFSWELDHDG